MTPKFDAELERLLRLPWTIISETSPEGDRLLRVLEIPSAVGTGHTDDELIADLWASLRESLRAYLEFGDEVPVPTDESPTSIQHSATNQVGVPQYFVVSLGFAKTGSNATASSSA